MPPLAWYGIILGIAAVVTAAATIPARWLSARVGYVAVPHERKVHAKATPYGGGAAMFMGFLVAMTVAALVPPLHVLFANSSEPLGVVLAGAAIFSVGLIDDVRDMSAPAKVAGQSGCPADRPYRRPPGGSLCHHRPSPDCPSLDGLIKR